jgi:hypothetical protein
MQLSRALPLALIATLAACLEVDESVAVRPDGSVHVQVTAKGDRADFEDGFPLPTGVPWQSVGLVEHSGPPSQDQELSLEAAFRSVSELPEFWAPPSEPYRSAGLERRSELEVTHKGSRTVYVFTRTLAARRFADWSPAAKIDAGLDDDLRAALEQETELTDEQWGRAAALVRGAYGDASRSLARSAVADVYTRGEAQLDVGAFERILDRVQSAVDQAISEPRLRALYAFAQHQSGESKEQREPTPPELDLDRAAREAVRAALPAALADAGVSDGVRNAVLGSLEWNFAALDQTTDLGDEELKLRLELPGRIVDGNFDALVDGRAVWKIDGSAVHDRDVVLRAVSVLE